MFGFGFRLYLNICQNPYDIRIGLPGYYSTSCILHSPWAHNLGSRNYRGGHSVDLPGCYPPLAVEITIYNLIFMKIQYSDNHNLILNAYIYRIGILAITSVFFYTQFYRRYILSLRYTCTTFISFLSILLFLNLL